RREIVYHHAADGVPLSGILYLPPPREPGTAVLAMHPRGDFTRHYLAPKLAAAGYAFLGTTTRYLNNDADALHERLLLDVAGTIAFLRGRGFSTVVLLGNSGGGSLFAFYLEQAAKPAAERLARAPSGDRVALGEVDMPAGDGLILLAAHLGEGRYLLVYRTLADPRHLDLSLDPSERRPGSIFSFGRDPVVGNYGEGLARVMSARGWLSTWSGLRSNAALERTLPAVAVPTQVICAAADTDIYPSECRHAFEV